MSSSIFQWVKEFKNIDMTSIIHVHPVIRNCVKEAVLQWEKKNSFGFSYNLYASGLSQDEIVYFAMREYLGSEKSEECFWEDLRRCFNGTYDFKFYNPDDDIDCDE